MRSVAFIGHGEIVRKDVKNRIEAAMRREIQNDGKNFILGMHGDFDLLSLSCCKKLKREFQDMTFCVAITSLSQINPICIRKNKKDVQGEHQFDDEIERQRNFRDFEENEYFEPLRGVDTIMFDIEHEYFKNKIMSSNRQMIDHCNKLICYVDEKRTKSRALKVMNYAKSKGCEIENLFLPQDDISFGMNEKEKEDYLRQIYEQLMELE